ncbi:Chromosome-partitioning ATPase Soj [uncultured bacterium]|nr:Chromosome-partitioning ATPase Soj [uncultured bacterium]
MTAAVDLQLRGKFYNALAKAIEPLHERMDFLLIDTPPSASLLTPSVLHIADYVLIPTLLERWGLDGIAEVYQVMADSVELHHAEVLGIIPNRTRLTTLEHKDRKDELLAQYDALVWEEIPESIVWSEAVDAQKSIFEYVPTHAASLAAVKLLKKFSEEVFARV